MKLQSNNDQRRSIVVFMILISLLIIPIAYRAVYIEYFYNSVNQIPSEEQHYTSHNAQPMIDNPLISSNADTTDSNGVIVLGLDVALALCIIVFAFYLKAGNLKYSKIGSRR